MEVVLQHNKQVSIRILINNNINISNTVIIILRPLNLLINNNNILLILRRLITLLHNNSISNINQYRKQINILHHNSNTLLHLILLPPLLLHPLRRVRQMLLNQRMLQLRWLLQDVSSLLSMRNIITSFRMLTFLPPTYDHHEQNHC